MLAAACLEFGMTPSEIRSLPRTERAFMFAAVVWKNEEESEGRAKAAAKARSRRKR